MNKYFVGYHLLTAGELIKRLGFIFQQWDSYLQLHSSHSSISHYYFTLSQLCSQSLHLCIMFLSCYSADGHPSVSKISHAFPMAHTGKNSYNSGFYHLLAILQTTTSKFLWKDSIYFYKIYGNVRCKFVLCV